MPSVSLAPPAPLKISIHNPLMYVFIEHFAAIPVNSNLHAFNVNFTSSNPVPCDLHLSMQRLVAHNYFAAGLQCAAQVLSRGLAYISKGLRVVSFLNEVTECEKLIRILRNTCTPNEVLPPLN